MAKAIIACLAKAKRDFIRVYFFYQRSMLAVYNSGVSGSSGMEHIVIPLTDMVSHNCTQSMEVPVVEGLSGIHQNQVCVF